MRVRACLTRWNARERRARRCMWVGGARVNLTLARIGAATDAMALASALDARANVRSRDVRARRGARGAQRRASAPRERDDCNVAGEGFTLDSRDNHAPSRADARVTSRRSALVTSTASFVWSTARAASAVTDIAYEGGRASAYAFDVPLDVLALRQSINSAAAREFSSTQGKRVKLNVKTAPSVADVYSAMASGGKKIKNVDVCTLGDEWLAPAISNGLILPLGSCERSAWYNGLSPIWQALVRRDPRSGAVSASGEVYGAPYRFGCSMLAYRKDKLPKGVAPPRDWSDLFDPRLKGLIGMPNAPRLVLSAALKAEGMSMNATDVGGVDGRVSQRVSTLRSNVKIFDDLQYLQALACGDCAVVVGPSEDIFSVARRSNLIGLVVPESGTSLWSDIWVVPSATLSKKSGLPSPAIEQWIEYTLQPARVNMRVGLKGGISPLMYDGSGIEAGYARYPSVARPVLGGEGDMLKGWIPPDSVWRMSEFQLPLNDRVRSQYVAMSKAHRGKR